MNVFVPSREPSLITLATVISRIENDQTIETRKRGEMLSGLRTICRLLDVPPGAVPAEPRNLRKRLETISPMACGLSRGRWSNIRSLTLSALTAAGVRAVPGSIGQPLAFAWEELRDKLVGQPLRLGLSSFLKFCSSIQVAPGDVDAAIFGRFHDMLMNDSLKKDPGTVYRRSCLAWNEASATIDAWPKFIVEVPDRRKHYSFPLEAFPVSFGADFDRYFESLANPNLFAKDYAPPLRPATIEGRRLQIVQIASAIVHAGYPLDQVTDLSVLVRPEQAEAAIRFFYQRAGEKKTEGIHQMLMLLRSIARKRTPKDDAVRELLDVLCHNFAVSVTGMRARNRSRLCQFDDPDNVDALLSLPERILEDVRRNDGGGYGAAMRIAYAVAIELLIVAPMRIKNLASLEHDRHFVRSRIGGDGIIHLCIPGEEMKNHDAYEMELPTESAELLRLYLRDYRPRMGGGVDCPWLFPGHSGRRRHPEAFSRDLSEFIFEQTGIRMHAHLFRHFAAKLYLDAHPEDVETARRILGHKSLKTTMKSYVDVKNAAAFRRYDAMIADRRRSGRERRSVSAMIKRLGSAA
jgi:integrase